MTPLLRKCWMQTRLRFFVSLSSILVMLSATLAAAPWLIASFRRAHPGTRYNLEEYLWRHWYGSIFVLIWALCAIVLGCGGLVWERGRGTSVLTLSLPIPRRQAAGAFLLVAYLEAFVLAAAPSVVLAFWERGYPWRDAAMFSFATFACGSVFLAFSFGLSHLCEGDFTASSIAIALAAFLWLTTKHPNLEWMNVFDLMAAEDRLDTGYLIGNIPGLMFDAIELMVASGLMCAGLLAIQRRING